MIENFILTLLEWGGHGKAESNYVFRLKLFHKTIKQIRFFYPKAKIHLISDRSLEAKNVICHLTKRTNHWSKFETFGLLDEPAMFMDSDILMTKPFSWHHLETDSPFNLFTSYKLEPKYPICSNYTHYNSGIIWIKQPNKKITELMFELHQNHFGEKENADEYAISLYVHLNQLEIKTHQDVNVYRSDMDYDDLGYYQTIHYPKKKELFLEEFGRFHSANTLLV